MRRPFKLKNYIVERTEKIPFDVVNPSVLYRYVKIYMFILKRIQSFEGRVHRNTYVGCIDCTWT